MRPLQVRWLGELPYARALAVQEQLVAARRDGACPDTLLLLEHPPVITLGRRSDAGNVLLGHDELARRGIELHETGRGGDVTYHGPGQLVGYPVIELGRDRRDAHRYLRDLEEALIRTAADYGVTANRVEGLTGIWVGEEKLGAIGVRLSTGWITSHGFALNVTTDLENFSAIVPCGIHDRGVTSLARLLGTEPEIREVAATAARHVAEVMTLQPAAADDPGERLAVADSRALSCFSRHDPDDEGR